MHNTETPVSRSPVTIERLLHLGWCPKAVYVESHPLTFLQSQGKATGSSRRKLIAPIFGAFRRDVFSISFSHKNDK